MCCARRYYLLAKLFKLSPSGMEYWFGVTIGQDPSLENKLQRSLVGRTCLMSS
jgi:hypothetical protein